MKKQTNFLWFFYAPADEREAALYQKAYQRAFTTLFFVIGATFYVMMSGVGEGTQIPTYIITPILAGLLLLSYVMGWSALRKEELTLEYRQIPALQTGKHVALIVLAIALSVGCVFLAQQHLLPSLGWVGFLSVAFIEAAVVYWAWRMTKPMPFSSRLVASFLFSPGIIFFMAWKKKGVGRFILSQILGVILYVVILIALMFPVLIATMTVLRGFTLDTNHFEPAIKEGTPIMIDTSDRTLEINEYLVFKGTDEKNYFGKVTGKKIDALIVDSSAGEQEVRSEQILGQATDPTTIPPEELAPAMEVPRELRGEGVN